MKLPKFFASFSVSLRASYHIAALLAILFFAGNIFLQIYFNVQPNVYLYAERLIMLILLLFFVAWSLITHTPQSKKICAYLTAFLSVFGIVVSLRHLWLQHHPVSMAQAAPITSSKWDAFVYIFRQLYYGDPAANHAQWTGLGYRLATWTCLIFVILLVLSFLQMRKKVKG